MRGGGEDEGELARVVTAWEGIGIRVSMVGIERIERGSCGADGEKEEGFAGTGGGGGGQEEEGHEERENRGRHFLIDFVFSCEIKKIIFTFFFV